jgi:hypothetical protein
MSFEFGWDLGYIYIYIYIYILKGFGVNWFKV